MQIVFNFGFLTLICRQFDQQNRNNGNCGSRIGSHKVLIWFSYSALVSLVRNTPVVLFIMWFLAHNTRRILLSTYLNGSRRAQFHQRPFRPIGVEKKRPSPNVQDINRAASQSCNIHPIV